MRGPQVSLCGLANVGHVPVALSAMYSGCGTVESRKSFFFGFAMELLLPWKEVPWFTNVCYMLAAGWK